MLLSKIRYLESEKELGEEKEVGEIIKFETDAIIVSQGEPGDEMFIILQGKVEVVIYSEFDGSETVVATLHAGQSFGEMSMVQGKDRSATIRSTENCILFQIKKIKFNDFMLKEPKIAINMMRMLSKRIIDVEGKIKDLLEVPVVEEEVTEEEEQEEENDIMKKLKELN